MGCWGDLFSTVLAVDKKEQLGDWVSNLFLAGFDAILMREALHLENLIRTLP